MQIGGLLAEKPKDDADDDEHEGHTNENTNHRRIDILKIGFLFLLSWNIYFICIHFIRRLIFVRYFYQGRFIEDFYQRN